MNHYDRADILRILHITPKQLSGWQRAGLAPVSAEYSFFDLIQLKKVRDLRAKRVSSAVILESLAAMRKQVVGMENPLLEASVYSVGSRVAFRHQGRSVEPVRGQFLMEYEPLGALVSAKVRPITSCETAADLFLRGVALEEHPSTHDEAIAVYMRVLEQEPDHAAAHINLGTLSYHRQDFAAAENHYRLAVKADPRYALAYFDLGNVLDETGKMTEAIAAYRTAIQLAPTYADAHYNLAIAYERQRQPRRALAHWKTYAKLDRVGPWSVHARNRIARILEGDKLKMVFRRQA
ncbi:MAG TPA: tetratricopeptide repeat protein [Candidatus Angelobacter sp.]|nr:tetratricopeptide repeat protein [Candidatus Angelobacter sp.]